MTPKNDTTKVVVVGAGVIGLTCAMQLARLSPRLEVTVVADFLPGDLHPLYTSPYAGANWMSFAASDDTRVQEIDRFAYLEFGRLAADPRAGIWRRKNKMCFTQLAIDREGGDVLRLVPWYFELANGRMLQGAELLKGTVAGFEFDGYVISVPIYLSYLVQQCLEAGVVVKRVHALGSMDEVLGLHASGHKADHVVNCAGRRGSALGGADPARNYVVRGQVVLVRNTISKVSIVDGFENPNEELYVFPRKEGGAIIGGSFYEDNDDPAEDTALTQRILDRARTHLPELVDPQAHGNKPELDVVQVSVGFRPFRETGPRLERDEARPWLIHAYGAGAGGYQGSYGFALAVVGLVNALARTLSL